MSTSGPAPSRMASRWLRRSRSTLRSTLISRAKRLASATAGRGTRRGKKLRIDPFVLKGVLSDYPRRETQDSSTDTRRTKTFVELAPANDAVFGGELDEVVVSPAGVAGEQFDASHFQYLAHSVSSFFDRQGEPDRRSLPVIVPGIYRVGHRTKCRSLLRIDMAVSG